MMSCLVLPIVAGLALARTTRTITTEEHCVMRWSKFIPLWRKRLLPSRSGHKLDGKVGHRLLPRLEALEERCVPTVITFAQFLQLNPISQNFIYTNTGGATASFSTIGTGDP